MKLSQPKSARIINRARVLCQLRKDGSLSKADLARLLELNKVSTGEIVEGLIEEGLACESGKLEVENGRKPTIVEIVKDSKYVLCLDIGARTVTVAVCNLIGEVVKMERIPTDVHCTVEEFCVGLLKSCTRTIKLIDCNRLLGIGITVSGKISIDGKVIVQSHYLPWKNIAIADVFENNFHVETAVLSSAESLVCAEKIYNQKSLVSSKPTMYLDWGDHISLGVIVDGKVVINNTDFGHIKVANTGICICGEIGCLETVCASWALSNEPDARLKNLWDKVGENGLHAMGKVLNFTSQIVGSDRVIVSGEAASIPEGQLRVIQDVCPKAILERSALGEKANIVACSQSSLDYYFYKQTMLDEMSAWM